MTAKKKAEEPKKVKVPAPVAKPQAAEPATNQKPADSAPAEPVKVAEVSATNDKMAAIKADVDKLATQYNNGSKLAHGKMMADAESKVKKKVDEYATESRLNFGVACRRAANPMAEALKLMFYPVLKASVRENKDTHLNEMVVDSDERQIDLKWLHGYITDGIGSDKTWLSKAAKFNKGLSAMANGALGKPVADFEASYKISAEADAESGFATNEATSLDVNNKNILNDLRIVVKAMIGEEHAEKFSKETGLTMKLNSGKGKKQTLGDVAVAYILMSHTTRKRGGGIATARERTMLEALATLCAYLMYNDDPAKALMLKLGNAKKSK